MRAQPAVDDGAETMRPQGTFARALRHRSLSTGVVICVVLGLLVFALPLIMRSVGLNTQDPMATFSPPSGQHLMGTDAFGRDMLSRVVYGGRTTILASISVVLLGCVFGTALGLIAG